MSHDVTIKLAPIIGVERMRDPRWVRPDRTLYHRHSLTFLPHRDSVALVVDHNMDRRVGTVHKLFEMEWPDGPWIMATGTVDAPPCWLKRHSTKASFGRWNVYEAETDGCRRVVQAFVKEVRLLSPTVEPAEPLARVMSLNRSAPTEHRPSSAARPTTAAAPVGQVIYHQPGTLIRRNIGQVLSVR